MATLAYYEEEDDRPQRYKLNGADIRQMMDWSLKQLNKSCENNTGIPHVIANDRRWFDPKEVQQWLESKK